MKICCLQLTHVCNLCSPCCSTVNPPETETKELWGTSNDDDMCEIDDKDDFSEGEAKFKSLMSDDIKVVELSFLMVYNNII